MNVSSLKVGDEIKNYKAMCSQLNEEIKTGESKQIQIEKWKNYFLFDRDGHAFKIVEVFDEPLEGKQSNSNKYVDVLGSSYNRRIYNIWINMKRRCYDLENKNYKDYGGRGIEICNEWLDSETGFINFYTWASRNGYSDDLSIDRMNVDGNYTPDNCRWATAKVQANNRRRKSKHRSMSKKELIEYVKLLEKIINENNLSHLL